MTVELEGGAKKLWEDFRNLFYFKDESGYFLENEKFEYPVGLIIKGFDPTFFVERILAVPLNCQGAIGTEQMLFEFWTQGIHEGQLAVSRIRARYELRRLGVLTEFNTLKFPAEAISAVSSWLANLRDSTWRGMVKEILNGPRAQEHYRKWFV